MSLYSLMRPAVSAARHFLCTSSWISRSNNTGLSKPCSDKFTHHFYKSWHVRWSCASGRVGMLGDNLCHGGSTHRPVGHAGCTAGGPRSKKRPINALQIPIDAPGSQQVWKHVQHLSSRGKLRSQLYAGYHPSLGQAHSRPSRPGRLFCHAEGSQWQPSLPGPALEPVGCAWLRAQRQARPML